MAATKTKAQTLNEQDSARACVDKLEQALSRRRLEFYAPAPKQRAFHEAGAEPEVRERMLIAANQVGKTTCAGAETAMHLTGRYPAWWTGLRFDGPVVWWTGAPTGQLSRDNPQRILLGRADEGFGTGMIPATTILKINAHPHGVKDQIESAIIQHVSGKRSTLVFKNYEQGRAAWQGETITGVWNDEEPPLDVYTEGLTRTNKILGPVLLTFTPLLGMSNVVLRFLKDRVPGTHVTTMTLEEAPWYTEAQRASITSAYPEHEREARVSGVPTMGSGRIYPVAEDRIREAAMEMPIHWPRLVGLDIGYDHPTAAVWLAWDRDADIVHVYDAYRVAKATPIIHAAAILARGKSIPVAWPHDALQHDKGGSCEQIAMQYRKLGVAMLEERATHPPVVGETEGSGGFGVEAGIMALLDRMQTGRLRVAAHLLDWFEEYRLYHRENGRIAKSHDDLMDATRTGIMMLRFARTPMGRHTLRRTQPWHPTDRVMGTLG